MIHSKINFLKYFCIRNFRVNLDVDALKTVIAAALKNLTHRKLLMEINGRYKLSAKTDLADEDETQVNEILNLMPGQA